MKKEIIYTYKYLYKFCNLYVPNLYCKFMLQIYTTNLYCKFILQIYNTNFKNYLRVWSARQVVPILWLKSDDDFTFGQNLPKHSIRREDMKVNENKVFVFVRYIY